jgi:alcohol dehydrogenase class IV
VTTADAMAHVALVELLVGWTAALGAPRLADLGLTAGRIGSVLEGVSANSLAGNPVDLTRDDLAAILSASL